MKEPVHLDAEKARAGEPRRNVRYVLFISLALVVVIYIGILLWGDAKAPDNAGNTAAITNGAMER